MAQRPPSIWELVTIGSTMVGCIVGGLLVGLLVDHFTHTSPAFVLAGIGLGLVLAGIAMYSRVRNYLK